MSGKGIAILGVAVGVSALIYGAANVSSKVHAAEKMQLAFNKLQIKKASWANGIQMNVVLRASNPTATDLEFSQPYVQVFVQDSSGNFAPIAISEDAKKQIALPGRKTSDFDVSLQMTALQALKVPGFAGYVIKKYLGLDPGAPRKVLIEYSTTAAGNNISGKTDVTL